MRPGERRGLTVGERALADEVFCGGLVADRVRLVASPLPLVDRPFVAGTWFRREWVLYPHAGALADFSTTALPRLAVFVHELVHVWQSQQGVFLPFAKLRAGDSRASYAYRLEGDPTFAAMNIEQQAMAVEHAFRLSRGGDAPYAAEAYARCLPFRLSG